MNYTHIVWDFDGTLFDTYPSMTLAAQKALSDAGIEESLDDIYRLIKVSSKHAFEHYTAKYGDISDVARSYTLYEASSAPQDRLPLPFAKEICQGIMGCGGKNIIMTHRDHKTLEELLACHGMLGLFTDLVCGDDGFKRKPHPEAFIHIAKKHGLAPPSVLVVGDRDIDILAGQGAGMRTCYLLDKDESKPTTFRADFYIDSLHQMAKILGLEE